MNNAGTQVKSATTGYRKAPRVARMLTEHIRQGKFVEGDLLPSENELARDYGVSRMTLRKALATLVASGVVTRLPQRGIVVPSPLPGKDPANGQTVEAKTARRISIAALWTGVADYSISRRLDGIRRYNEANGIQFRNYLAATNEETIETLARIEDLEVEGILVYPFRDLRYEAALRRLVDKKFPIVSFRGFPEFPISSVGSDDGVWTYQAVHYLLRKYKRPVYLITELQGADSAPERNLAYRSAMVDAGFGELVDSHTRRLETGSGDPTYWPMEKKWLPGFHTAQKLLAEVKPPVTIFAHNDFTASGVYRAAEKLGWTVGTDVCVMGMDDLPLAELLSPPLTTVRASIEEIGYEAARLLHRLILGKAQPPINIRLPMELAIRGSA